MAPLQVDEELVFDVLVGDATKSDLWSEILNQFLEAEMSEHLQADRYEQTEKRTGYRHGSYERQLTTRVGPVTLQVPRCDDGSFSTMIFERYQRSEKALALALMEMYVQGVSTRRVKKITTELCGYDLSKSTVSRLTKKLDEQVEVWAERPLGSEDENQTRYPFVLADAMHVKVRRQGAVRSTTVLIAIGISRQGQREILGLDMAFGETRDAWKKFFEKLYERGLTEIELLTSDAHEGLREAAEAVFSGFIWQRCQAHFRRSILDDTPDDLSDGMHDLLDTVLEAEDPFEARQVFEEVLDGKRQRLEERVDKSTGEVIEVDTYARMREEIPEVLSRFEEDLEDVTAVLALPGKYARRLRTTNMLERLIEELRRREKVIRIFPNIDSAWRLIGALLSEYHDEWSTGRRYLKMDAYYDWRAEVRRETEEGIPTELPQNGHPHLTV